MSVKKTMQGSHGMICSWSTYKVIGEANDAAKPAHQHAARHEGNRTMVHSSALASAAAFASRSESSMSAVALVEATSAGAVAGSARAIAMEGVATKNQ